MSEYSLNEIGKHLKGGMVLTLEVPPKTEFRRIDVGWDNLDDGGLYWIWSYSNTWWLRANDTEQSKSISVVIVERDNYEWVAFIEPSECAVCILPVEVFLLLMDEYSFLEVSNHTALKFLKRIDE